MNNSIIEKIDRVFLFFSIGFTGLVYSVIVSSKFGWDLVMTFQDLFDDFDRKLLKICPLLILFSFLLSFSLFYKTKNNFLFTTLSGCLLASISAFCFAQIFAGYHTKSQHLHIVNVVIAPLIMGNIVSIILMSISAFCSLIIRLFLESFFKKRFLP